MSKKILIITAALLVQSFLVPFAIAEDKQSLTQEEKARQKMLKIEAANAFWRLKHSLEKDAFYSGRIRLNVWRSTAIEAGTFDQAQYDEFKTQLYAKSIEDSMKCYEEFILEENYYDANICLQTWRMHSRELGTYDKEKYEALKERLKQERINKAAREAEEKKNTKKRIYLSLCNLNRKRHNRSMNFETKNPATNHTIPSSKNLVIPNCNFTRLTRISTTNF